MVILRCVQNLWDTFLSIVGCEIFLLITTSVVKFNPWSRFPGATSATSASGGEGFLHDEDHDTSDGRALCRPIGFYEGMALLERLSLTLSRRSSWDRPCLIRCSFALWFWFVFVLWSVQVYPKLSNFCHSQKGTTWGGVKSSSTIMID